VNTRGVGGSEGWSTWRGVDEREDVLSALAYARTVAKRVLLVAYSFGAAVGLSAVALHRESALVDAVACVGYPKGFLARFLFFSHYAHVDPGPGVPKLFLLGDADEFTAVGTMRDVFAGVSEPKELRIVQGDHFMFGREQVLVDPLVEWASRL